MDDDHTRVQEELAQTLEAVQHAARKVRRVIDDNCVDTSFEGPAVKPVFRKYND